MTIGIISDIEGNDRMLDVVLDKLAGCCEIINLGDSVGTCGDSNQVIARLEACCIRTVLGNHDLEILENRTVAADRTMAEQLADGHDAFESEVDLTARSRDYLQRSEHAFQNIYSGRRVTFQHALLGYLDGQLYFDYVTRLNAQTLITEINTDIAFVGHSHVPVIMELNDDDVKAFRITDTVVDLPFHRRRRYVVNPGSIGAPRSLRGQDVASYAIMDTERMTLTIEVHRG